MSKDRATDLAERLLALVPEDGTPVGNRALRTRRAGPCPSRTVKAEYTGFEARR